jgi:hypothetical protein
MSRSARVGSALLLWAVCACSAGQIEEPPARPWDGPNGSPFSPRPGSQGGAGQGGITVPNNGNDSWKPAPAALRKLTVEQYQNSVHDLLGADIRIADALEPDTAQNGFFAVGASNATISPASAEKLERMAYDVAAQALAPAKRAQLVPCTPAGVNDSSCAHKFVQKLGRRAFRRPLTDAELDKYTRVASDAALALNDFHAGLEFALAGLLQSPNFLFRVELGESNSKDATRLSYSQYELASRLSYALWNTTPDDALLDAAQSGKLDVSSAAERLLTDARAKAALDNFHLERLGLGELESLEKDEGVVDMTDSLRAALRDDVLETFALYAGAGQDIMQVFDSRTVFVNAELADIYGLPNRPSTLTRAELAANVPRLGLLGKPALLALNAHATETSPTKRGKFIRERILCQSIPAPPANVVTVLGEPDPDAPTMRDRLRVHATDASCSGCHNLMDPLGLALEHFDPIGRYRDTDHNAKLDVSGNLDGEAFDGAVELAQLIKDDPRTAECLVRQVFRYALGHVETAGEEPQITLLMQQFEKDGHALNALFHALATSDVFRYAGKETP